MKQKTFTSFLKHRLVKLTSAYTVLSIIAIMVGYAQTKTYEICEGDDVTLEAVSSGTNYKWETMATTRSITVKPTKTTEYKVEIPNVELLENGDFKDSTNMDFTTSYNIKTSAFGYSLQEGQFAVTANPNYVHKDFRIPDIPYYDMSNKNFMVFNTGSNKPILWKKTVKVEKNMNYNFSFWLGVLVSSSPKIKIVINGEEIAENLKGEDINHTWSFHEISWNSKNATTATISIQDNGKGNDFTLYDLSFKGPLSETHKVVVNPLPNFSITGPEAICQNASATLTATPTKSSDNISFSWSNGTTGTKTSVTDTETYTATGTLNGCKKKETFAVKTINPLPDFSITGPDAICQNESATLTATPKNSSDNISFSWSNGTTGTTTSVTDTKTYTATGTFKGCEAKKTFAVTDIKPLPDFSITGPTAICQNESATLTATPKKSSDNISFTWSNGKSGTKTSVNDTKTYTATGTLNGCESKQSFAVKTIKPLPEFTITGETDFCEGEHTMLQATQANPNQTISYVWNNSIYSNTLRVEKAGTHTIQATLNGCTVIKEKEITIKDKPKFEIIGKNVICEDETAYLKAQLIPENTQNDVTYKWDPTNETTPDIKTSTSGNYTVFVTKNLCTSTDDTTVIVKPLPRFELKGPIEICEGDSAHITIDVKGATYEWSTGATKSFIYAKKEGRYTVTATLDNCTYTEEVYVHVKDRPVPLVIEHPKESCTYDTLRFATKGKNVQWYAKDSTFIVGGDFLSIPTPSAGTHTYFATQTENHERELNGYTYSCTSDKKEFKTIVHSPQPHDMTLHGTWKLCETDRNILYSAQSPHAVSWSTYSTKPLYTTIDSLHISVGHFKPGVDTLYAFSTDKNNCNIMQKRAVLTSFSPVVDFNYEVEADILLMHIDNKSFQFPIKAGQTTIPVPVLYNWSIKKVDDADTIFIIQTEEDKHVSITDEFPIGTHFVELTAENEYGCVETIQKDVYMNKFGLLYIPTSFSPNNESEKVRYFNAVGYGLKSYSIKIYDKWGNLVWFSDALDENGHPSEMWDGQYNGVTLHEGTYIWKIEAEFTNGYKWEGTRIGNGRPKKWGSVSIVK